MTKERAPGARHTEDAAPERSRHQMEMVAEPRGGSWWAEPKVQWDYAEFDTAVRGSFLA